MNDKFNYVSFRNYLLKLTNGYWTLYDVLEKELQMLSDEGHDVNEIINTMTDLNTLEIKTDWQASFANAYKDGDITIPRTEEMKIFRVT